MRAEDAAAALRLYAGCPAAELAADPERSVWIFQQIRRTLDGTFDELIELVSETGRGLEQRWALHLRATSAWYGGHIRDAKQLWRRAVDAGRDVRDELWGGCVENLAMVHSYQGNVFESLVLGRVALERAIEGDFPYSIAHGGARLGRVFTGIGEYERAAAVFDVAASVLERLDDSRSRTSALHALTGGRAWLHFVSGDFRRALEQHEAFMSTFAELGPNFAPVEAGAVCTRIRLEYEIYPERRAELMAQLEAVPESHPVGEHWTDAWLNELLPMRLRHAIELGDRGAALAAARAWLDFVDRFHTGANLVQFAVELGAIFADELDSPQDSHRAYELAADGMLRLLLTLNRSAQELPELDEVRKDDLELLEKHRARLATRRDELGARIVALWRAGHPARELVLDADGTLKACSWCSRVLSSEGRWLPAAELLPPEDEFQVTHGICPHCSDAFRAELAGDF
ncbi:MAG: hypothetical protein H6828_06945 [Planctomycetes bacterium]|nr:hypothetical protein [Planctomycetota bacterium]